MTDDNDPSGQVLDQRGAPTWRAALQQGVPPDRIHADESQADESQADEGQAHVGHDDED